MPTIVQLPNGHSATLRDRLTTERQRRPLEIAAVAAGPAFGRLQDAAEAAEGGGRQVALSWDEAEAVARLQDAGIIAYLESWTRDEPLPTMETVGDMDPDTFDALGVAVLPLLAQMSPRTDFSVSPDPLVPTARSSSLSVPSSPGASSLPTPQFAPGTENTSTAPSTPA